MRTIGWLAGGGDLFLRPILDHLGERYRIRPVDRWPDPAVDLLWVEWCDRALVEVTSKPKTRPVVTRLHSFEVFREFGDLPARVDWSNVDALVVTTGHVRDYALAKFGIEGPEVLTIPQGVDLERFRPGPPRERGRKVAWVGTVSYKKGPGLFVQAVASLAAADPAFEFHVAGEIQQERYEVYFDHLLGRLGVRDRVHFHGAIRPEEMPDFYRGMGSAEGLSEQFLAPRAFLRDECRYEFPVHNRLTGVRDTVLSRAVIRSSYEGTLAEKAARSIPLLEKLAEERPESAHAVFHLAMTHLGLGRMEETRKWARRSVERAGEEPRYAAARVWLFYATLALEGRDAARAVLDEAVARHPALADLHHARLLVTALDWLDAARSPGPYAFTPQSSIRHLSRFPEIVRVLGLPLELSRGPEGTAGDPGKKLDTASRRGARESSEPWREPE